jgi:hypothetical protein
MARIPPLEPAATLRDSMAEFVRVWRTIRPEKKHPCWREFVRLGIRSSSDLSAVPFVRDAEKRNWRRRTSDQRSEFANLPLLRLPLRVRSVAIQFVADSLLAIDCEADSGFTSEHHPRIGSTAMYARATTD